ncbi:MAG: ABC transporter permease [Amphritea sp.]|nr:ABC transporter permease [Amphritea sp.]
MHASISSLVLNRLLLGVVTLFVISIIIFCGVELLPGDLAQEILGQSATPESIAAFRQQLGLDRPATERYLEWLLGVVSGDFGASLANGREISELMGERLGNTLFLAGMSALISIPLALTLGVLAALYRNTAFDKGTSICTLTAISYPEFFVAYILIFLLAQTGFFPSISNISGDMSLMEKAYRTVLPALTMTMVVTAHMMRMTRAALINLLGSPYIEMARLKGVSPARVIVRHALPNALGIVINVIALNLAYLVVGVVIVEVVFVYPGLGQLLVDSVAKRDITVVQACSLIFAMTYVLLNLLADVLSTLSNPRLIHQR